MRFLIALIITVAAIAAAVMVVGTGDITSFFAGLNAAAFIFPILAIALVVGMIWWYRSSRRTRRGRDTFSRFAVPTGLVALAWLITHWWLSCSVPGFYGYVLACLTLFMFLTGLWIIGRAMTEATAGSRQNLHLLRSATNLGLALAFAWLLIKIGQYVADNRSESRKASPCCSYTKPSAPQATQPTAAVTPPTLSDTTDIKVGKDTTWVQLNPVCKFSFKVFGNAEMTMTVILADGKAVLWTPGADIKLGPQDRLGFTTSSGSRVIITQSPPPEIPNENCKK